MAALWIKEDLREEEEEEGCLVQSLVVEVAAQRLHIAISSCMTMVQMQFTLFLKNRQGRGMSSISHYANYNLISHTCHIEINTAFSRALNGFPKMLLMDLKTIMRQ